MQVLMDGRSLYTPLFSGVLQLPRRTIWNREGRFGGRAKGFVRRKGRREGDSGRAKGKAFHPRGNRGARTEGTTEMEDALVARRQDFVFVPERCRLPKGNVKAGVRGVIGQSLK
jgi:hypothetical protein